MPERILLRFRSAFLSFILVALAGCSFYLTELRSEHYERNYRLTENAMSFTGLADPRPGERGQLQQLRRELEIPAQFPIGTRVRVLKIRKNHGVPELGADYVLLRIGEGSKAVEVFAGWPEVLDILEEVP